MKKTFNYGRSDKNSRITVNNNFSDLSIDRSWFSKSLSPVSAGCWERDREGRASVLDCEVPRGRWRRTSVGDGVCGAGRCNPVSVEWTPTCNCSQFDAFIHVCAPVQTCSCEIM